ncbi:alpha/beta hydrolase [Sphingobium sp.]|uniref:alpha/beta hydrolase n=1 Tax=Sphingobium sp. TaxID=1912891 RepID=UPI002C1ED448|nr:alpha/beta hydrolase [Sphingobium sp.]HUD90703.1 alpha/beta hydrolase [Sphingobium sp.]
MGHQLDPQVAEAFAAMLAGSPPPPPVPRGDWRALREQSNMGLTGLMAGDMPEQVQLSVIEQPNADGVPVSMRWYQREGSAPGSAILYFHGGGMIAGTAEMFDRALAGYVAATGVPMLSVDYRLAPEHPHPAQLDDGITALLWLIDHAGGLGVDPARIAVMGDSAGGGLAAALAALARDRGIALAAQILIYPMLDDRRTADEPGIAPFAVWTADNNWTGWHALVGDRIGGPDVPASAAPARQENFAGLAPAYIEVGDLDIFRDEDIAYALALSRAGVPIELHVHSSVPHAFELLAPDADVTKRAMVDRQRVISQL